MSSLGRFRLILKKQGLMVVVAHLFAKKVANVPDGLLNDFRGAALPRRPLMVRAALLRRSCELATESLLRRRCCCDGADAARSAAATELRRSCDGAATELRRSCDSRSFCASRLEWVSTRRAE